MAKLTADQIYGYAVGAGFSPDEAVTMTAIALAESGGNTGAHNPVGEDSRGLWQVNMRAHSGWVGNKDLYDPAVAAWAARQVYLNAGSSISPWTVTHAKNASKNGYARFQGDAQAAARNAGHENAIGNFNGVSGYGQKAPAGNAEGGTAAMLASGGGSPADVEQTVRDEYPEYAWLMDDPEVRSVLLDAVDPAGGLDDAAFMARIRQTQWYQTNGSSVRQWTALQQTDPASAARALQQKKVELQDRARRLGVTATDQELTELADRVLRYNLSEQELSVQFANLLAGDAPAGSVASTMVQLRAQTRDFLVNVGEDEMVRWARGIATGQASADDFAESLRGLAKAKFSGNEQLAGLIDSGLSPSAFFADHTRMIAQEWDLSPEQVDLLDPKWQGVLQTADGGKLRPMTLDETRKSVRSMEGWDKTTTGRAKVASATTRLLEKWGKVAF